jgi:RND family efflux transporter MFP subunit
VRIKKDRIVAVALGIVLAVGFIWSQRPHPPDLGVISAGPAVVRPVSAERVQKREIPVFSEGVGTVRSRRQTEIAARVLADVKEIHRQPGDAVEAGDVLITLDSMDLKARVEQAEANLKSLDENLKEAETEYARKKNLLEKDAVTQQEFDIAKFGLAATMARRDAAKKGLEEAQIQLGYATITAPFRGVVFEKPADPGDLATPGKHLLGLYDPEQLRLEALVEEGLLWKLKVKDPIEVDIDSPAQTIVGVVSEAVPAVDPSTRTGTLRIDLPPEAQLRPGMFGRARVPVSVRQAIVVPAGAVVRRGQLEMVFAIRLDEKSRQKRARMILVRTGQPVKERTPGTASGLVEILGGIEPGDLVVTKGAQGLRDGDLVDVAADGQGGAGAEGR